MKSSNMLVLFGLFILGALLFNDVMSFRQHRLQSKENKVANLTYKSLQFQIDECNRKTDVLGKVVYHSHKNPGKTHYSFPKGEAPVDLSEHLAGWLRENIYLGRWEYSRDEYARMSINPDLR